MLFVSHNMASIEYLCKKGILLDHGAVAYSGNVKETLDSYQKKLLSYLSSNNDEEPHLLYKLLDTEKKSKFYITQIEIFENGEPLQAIFTWSKITFRIHYHADYFY